MARNATKNVNTKITILNIRDKLTEGSDLPQSGRVTKSRAVGGVETCTKS